MFNSLILLGNITMHDLEVHKPILAFRCEADLIALAEAAAKAEGISRSDVARRALMRDLQRRAKKDEAA